MVFSSVVDPVIVPINVAPPIDLVSTTSLKKKEVETKSSKRKRTWLGKKRKFTKKEGNTKEKSSKACDKKKEKSSKVRDKKKEKCSKVFNNTKYIRFSLTVFAIKSFNCI